MYLTPKGILKDLVRNLIDFQKNSKRCNTEIQLIFQGFPTDLVGFQLISEGFGKDLN